MTRILILGAGGNALDLLDVIDALNAVSPRYEVKGFLDDARPAGSDFAGHKVLGPIASAPSHGDVELVNAIGTDRRPERRAEIVAELGLPPERYATLVHPAAGVSSRARLGRGVCVNHGVSIGGGAFLGDHVWIGARAVLGHDVEVGDGAVVAPAAVLSGFVRVERSAYIGSNACIRQRVTVGVESIVGMGAVVLSDVPPRTVVVGNPARARLTSG